MSANLKRNNNYDEELPIKLFSVSYKEDLDKNVDDNINIDEIVELINRSKIIIPKYEELFPE